MTTQLLLVTGVTDCLWLYVLSLLLFLTVCFLLYQNFLLRKSASADDDYRRFLFDILDNLPVSYHGERYSGTIQVYLLE